ncbi:MAG: hypothetical protein IJC31_04995, partial [Spirochaetaceae bacterium]|nr:hypothetical protein [Spirochaetaceae bacterium]
EGGFRGGTVVTTGTPEEVACCQESHTGLYIKEMLERQQLGLPGLGAGPASRQNARPRVDNDCTGGREG